MTAYFYNPNKELNQELNALINKHGFVQVLSILESLASDNADMIGSHWEVIRKNLENSLLEIEEYSITNLPN
jgi:tRNA A37 threonylcarbamoyltransferase TsaD